MSEVFQANRQLFRADVEPHALTAIWQHDSYDNAAKLSRYWVVICNLGGVHYTCRPSRCTFGPVMFQVMAKYLWSYMTPWVRNDVNFVIHTQKVVEGLPFLGMHVRRGDKLADEAKATGVKVRSAQMLFRNLIVA